MSITLNEKKYTINTDIKFGLLRKFYSNKGDMEIMVSMIKEILVPTISDEEVDDLQYSDILEIMQKFGEEQKKLQSNYKKKRSPL